MVSWIESALTDEGRAWIASHTKEEPVMKEGFIDRSRMKWYKERRLVSETRHTQTSGDDEMFLYNYTAKCSYDKAWDDVTRQCRGLIVNQDGKVLARPFPKFFNLHEHKGKIPEGPVEVYEKVDGSMVTVTWALEQGLIVATRGSFTSSQALHARELLVEKYKWETWLRPHYTYIFEVVYPTNRIVVNYGEADELVLLGIVRTYDGKDVERSYIDGEQWPFRVAKSYGTVESNELQYLYKRIEPNNEGFVLLFSNGLRLKVKSEEYLRLHRLLTNTNNKTIWEILASGRDFDDMLTAVPDEFMWWIKNTRKGFVDDFNSLDELHQAAFEEIRERPRPQFAAGVADAEREDARIISAVLYRMKDNRTYDDLLWKALKPTVVSVPPVGEHDADVR